MEINNEKVSRRNFIYNFSIIGAAALAAVVFVKYVFAFLFPSLKQVKEHKYMVARESDIPVGKAKEITLGKKPAFVVRLEDGYKVFSGVCTHLGCIVRWEEEKSRFYCPCHQGIFDKSGKVTDGPPPRPLDEYRVEIERNMVFVYIPDKKKGPWS